MRVVPPSLSIGERAAPIPVNRSLSLCRGFDLLIGSDVLIPGSVPLEADALPMASPDLRIRFGKTSLSEEHGSCGPYRSGPEGLLFEKPGVARFLCSWDGQGIQFELCVGATLEEAISYLIATAIPAVLWLRGDLVLHGAAAIMPGQEKAMVLIGDSGSGKSTLLESLVREGGRVVSEDSLCLRETAGRITASGLPACLHLRSPGSSLDSRRTVHPVPETQCAQSAEISAIIVLEPRDNALDSHMERLDTVAAISALLAHRHRPRVPEFLNLSGGQLPRWAALARAFPVYSWKTSRMTLHIKRNLVPWSSLV